MLLSFGGSDPDDLTRTAIDAVAGLEPEVHSVTALVGPENPHAEALRELAEERPRVRTVHAPPEVAPLMAAADVAAAAAGSTVWELAFMMLPSVLVSAAGNQDRNARGLTAEGIASKRPVATGRR